MKKVKRLSRSILLKLFEKVHERDNYTCQICGKEKYGLDYPHHVLFKSRGGSDTNENLITLCMECHRKVHDEKTKELMLFFYQHLLNGDSYSEALRNAKLDCITKGYLPLNWAGFVIIGR